MLKTQSDGGRGRLQRRLPRCTSPTAPGSGRRNGNTKDGGITLRGEYFLDDRDGHYTDPNRPGRFTAPWNGQRRGAYLEGVYRLNRTWDVGYRYDKLVVGDGQPSPFAERLRSVSRNTAELTWRNSEFSLFRLQLSHDKPNPDDSRQRRHRAVPDQPGRAWRAQILRTPR